MAENREAGLVLHAPELAQYYGQIFQADWTDALTKLPARRARRREEEVAATRIGPADRGDYTEV